MSEQNDENIWAELDSKEFSGETEFQKLTPSQKLEWLTHASALVATARQLREEKNLPLK